MRVAFVMLLLALAASTSAQSIKTDKGSKKLKAGPGISITTTNSSIVINNTLDTMVTASDTTTGSLLYSDYARIGFVDKANSWIGNQTFSGNVKPGAGSYYLGTSPSNDWRGAFIEQVVVTELSGQIDNVISLNGILYVGGLTGVGRLASAQSSTTTPYGKPVISSSFGTSFQKQLFVNFKNTSKSTALDTVYIIHPDIGVTSDDFVLANATQTLRNKTWNGLPIDTGYIAMEKILGRFYALADTGAFVGNAVRAAVYVGGAKSTDRAIITWRLPAGDESSVPTEVSSYYYKSDTLVVLRSAGTTANLKFSWMRIPN